MNQLAAFEETVALATKAGMPEESPISDSLGLAHMRDMQKRIAEGNFSEAKLGRWLGWAQAALVAANVGVTLEDMKQLNLRHAESESVLSNPVAVLAAQLEELNQKGKWWSHEDLAEHDRQERDIAWAEGYVAGWNDREAGARHKSPYRKPERETVEGCPLCWDLTKAVCQCGRNDFLEAELDPLPWRDPGNWKDRAEKSPFNGTVGWEFAPRSGYEQDRSKYGHTSSDAGGEL